LAIMGFSREKTRALGTLIKLLERGVVTGGDANEAMAHLFKVVGVDAVGGGQGYNFAGWSVREGLPDSWIRSHARYLSQDKIVPRLESSPPGSWFFVDRSSPQEKDSDLYSHFSKDFGDGALVRLYSPFISDFHLVLYRARKRRFTELDHMLLKLLYPHIASGFATRRALAALEAPASETLDDVLRSVAGYATISFPSAAVAWSTRARRFWRSRLEIGERGWGRLDRMLLQACARFERGALQARSQVLLPGARVDFANVPPGPNEKRRVVGLLIAETISPTEELAPAAELLTQRQRALARLLVAGSTLPDAARKLGISLETTRGYRDEIYQRLGVKKRVELIATLR
jgi:DNA-binding CsgD family transcriptional regulator